MAPMARPHRSIWLSTHTSNGVVTVPSLLKADKQALCRSDFRCPGEDLRLAIGRSVSEMLGGAGNSRPSPEQSAVLGQ